MAPVTATYDLEIPTGTCTGSIGGRLYSAGGWGGSMALNLKQNRTD